MNIILKNRCGGKTHDLIRMSAETGIPIVSMNPAVVKVMAKEYGLVIPEPMSITDCIRAGDLGAQVYVDEIDAILGKLLHAKPVCGTMTPDHMSIDL